MSQISTLHLNTDAGCDFCQVWKIRAATVMLPDNPAIIRVTVKTEKKNTSVEQWLQNRSYQPGSCCQTRGLTKEKCSTVYLCTDMHEHTHAVRCSIPKSPLCQRIRAAFWLKTDSSGIRGLNKQKQRRRTPLLLLLLLLFLSHPQLPGRGSSVPC